MNSYNIITVYIKLHVYFLCLSSTELASGIVSTTLQCGDGRCDTGNIELDTPVRIYIQHSADIKVYVIGSYNYVVCNNYYVCVFIIIIVESLDGQYQF